MGRAFEYRKASKLKRWGAMSKLFPKLGKIITMAAKEGGIDPDMNARLRTAIINAKAENMPKDNIEAAIKRASSKDTASMLEVSFEGKAPHGVQLFIECMTDNNTRTVANVKNILTKHGGEMLIKGSLEFMFDRKALFEFSLKDDMNLEELELELIDAGLEEIEAEDGVVIVTADYKSFGAINSALESMGIEITKAVLERMATSPISLTEQQQADIDKILDKLEDDEDVQKVFTNIA
ncbi:MAG: transcriptional regulator [Sulfurimonas sp. RIFCSPHIGHO2_12_FULL_36_9]|jgi:YebC/PmpR family DNA-binding regulatory protein|uniref:YebC/PmpR family DNA-binding transcriptional regulator n=1 Tax=unclassified Sulfurimonas TaxID=2623549 RepID=UPI0008B967BA|nr:MULTISPECIES: YebC/PmpR family DNA-binding transcriptional regulator [unclassified Sulfurimonas]OHD98663.1 MAG: transcriptional regulator [Sulfurimonas sp. RIFCSPHIGHO2_12_FULL_36_9]OHE00773.1 MAG: transcriptional regulator [Sulfurimonas sp. RIFCSPLOWO2_02_FULL_36_28]OHE02240.1 MAG: transcriptional regulator [Sulfurimonas sp. RIFCSPLOWO2_12_36_12]OHE04757.1 MAG: transcriptional regulator [Sulfurimonas sp. RIFCSPLOWO2_12_FULL_36_74]